MAGVLSDINALLDLLGKAVKFARKIHNDSKDMEDFDEKVDRLRRRQAYWADLLRRCNPRAQQLVRGSLEAAIEILEREEVAFKHRHSSCCLTWRYRTLDSEYGNLGNVSQAFDNILQTLKEIDEAEQVLDRLTNLAPLPFGPDKKYVPVQYTSTEVQQALENSGGPSVVTLYGEPGSGKSTVAKFLALLYDEARKQQQRQPLRCKGKCFADGVFFLACGPGATSRGLHVELWQSLGFRALFEQGSQQQGQTSIATDEQQPYSESLLHKQLTGRLVDSSALIILDDVSDAKLLERLLLPGRGLKYLVTSQDRGVWEDAVQIHMEKPSLEEARQILANHVVGLPQGVKELPFNLQDVADAMIRASEFNPLVLANLALTISNERATNAEEWMTAKKYLLELLDDSDRAPIVYGQRYPQTVASSMTMAVNSMPVEVKNLLFLAAICDGPSVPEIVLKVFFKGLHGSLARFQKWANYLEDRAIIQIEHHALEWTDDRQRIWSVHRLRQYFVLEKKKDDVTLMLSQLHSTKHSDADIVSALYLLFAGKSWIHEDAAGMLGILQETNNFNWSSIKPFVWLLHSDGDEEWKHRSHEFAKKIIVRFVCSGNLDDGGLSSLLEMSQVQPATCWALETIARLEKKPLLTEQHGATLRALLGLLGEAVHPNIQSWGAVALGALALENHKTIVTHPSALKQLLVVLKGNPAVSYDVQLYAAWTIGNLASTSHSKCIIASYPGILEALVKLLDTEEDLDVQRESAYALRRLAYVEPTTFDSRQTRMIAIPGMLESLVHLLGRSVDPNVQREVVWLLGNLAVSHDDKMRVRDCPGVLHGLVGLISKEARFDTQRYHAAYALRRLTLKTGDSKLFEIPSALERLVSLLENDERPDEQQEAAHCLSFLAYPLENRIIFVTIPGVVKGLVGLLQGHMSPSSQLIATGTLANLVEVPENKLLIASEPGALQGLVNLLLKRGCQHDVKHSELAELVVRCLGQLAFENYENKLTIASFPGVLEGLLGLFDCREAGSSWVQQLVAWTLSNLAEAEENKSLIAAFPQAVPKLNKVVAESSDPDAQWYAKVALTLISNSTSVDISQWKLEERFQSQVPIMRDEAIDDKGPLALGQVHPLTVASSMSVALDSMAIEAKNLLFLAAICDGPFVPETVLKVLFKGLHKRLDTFQKWSNYLEDRAFIQIETQEAEWTDLPQRTWSMHPLRQQFLLEKKKDDVSQMVSMLCHTHHNDADILSALYLLFAAEPWCHLDMSGMPSLSKEKSNFNANLIKPFVLLLHADAREEWKHKSHTSAKQIIISYVTHGDLDNDGLSSLLQMSQVQVATCWALETVARPAKKPLLTDRHAGTLKSLFGLLGNGVHPNIQSWGAKALEALALENHQLIMEQPSVLMELLGLLKGNLAINSNVQMYAACTLGNLAATSKSRCIITSCYEVLEALVTLLDANEDVQREAAYALRRLAYSESAFLHSGQTRIIKLPGMLEKLVGLLGRSVDPDVQKEVVWLLGNLATSSKDKMRIRDCHGVLQGLVGMLAEESKFDTHRYHATYALRRLTLKTGDSKLLGIPGALERLMALLVKDERPDEQQEAAHCLSYLAYPLENRIDFAAIPGVVKGLVHLLQEHVSPSTQLIATGTLANLVEVVENKLLVASEPGALHSLVRFLGERGSADNVLQSELVELAIRCLGQLAFENYENQVTIAALPGTLEGLLGVLDGTEPRSSRVQQDAAWTLSNLAEAERNRSFIAAFPTAVQKLTELVAAESTDSDLRRYAKTALTLVLNSTSVGMSN